MRTLLVALAAAISFAAVNALPIQSESGSGAEARNLVKRLEKAPEYHDYTLYGPNIEKNKRVKLEEEAIPNKREAKPDPQVKYTGYASDPQYGRYGGTYETYGPNPQKEKE